MAREVFPSLLATPVSSVSLSGFSMPEWAIGKWAATPYSDSPSVEPARGETIAIATKTIAGSSCKHVNYTVIALNENIADLRVDRRSKCVLDDVPVSRILLSKTPDANRITISLYAIGSDFSGAPNTEGYYQKQDK